jgi:hypothetical protein
VQHTLSKVAANKELDILFIMGDEIGIMNDAA